jgi:hypothetical protein
MANLLVRQCLNLTRPDLGIQKRVVLLGTRYYSTKFLNQGRFSLFEPVSQNRRTGFSPIGTEHSFSEIKGKKQEAG